MIDHKVRRLPVIDGHDLIGIVSQADLAQALDNADAGELVEAISARLTSRPACRRIRSAGRPPSSCLK
jgi:CBS domain-containing protein